MENNSEKMKEKKSDDFSQKCGVIQFDRETFFTFFDKSSENLISRCYTEHFKKETSKLVHCALKVRDSKLARKKSIRIVFDCLNDECPMKYVVEMKKSELFLTLGNLILCKKFYEA
jgi:hypothetical protein